MDNNFVQNPNMMKTNNNQTPKQEKPIDENDSSQIDELAGTIYQIIEAKYPK